MSLKRRRSDEGEAVAASDVDQQIFISESIEDRTSTFIGYFSPTIPPKELQSQANIESASHRMLAWRRRSSSQRTIGGHRHLESSFDDDGERYGGKKVLGVLEALQIEGSLVVARWYGGIMLGPVRFTHIETCAREAVRSWQQHELAVTQEKSRIQAEEKEKDRLIDELKERDGSISALRSLLGSKTETKPTASLESKPPSQTQGMDYAALPLPRLRLLDKARDSTIAFLLKEIDAAESKRAESPGSAVAQADVDTKTDAQPNIIVTSDLQSRSTK